MPNQRKEGKAQISSWVKDKNKSKLYKEAKRRKTTPAEVLDEMLDVWSFESDINVLRAVAKREGIPFEEFITKLTKNIRKNK
jgi:hypothetical protein